MKFWFCSLIDLLIKSLLVSSSGGINERAELIEQHKSVRGDDSCNFVFRRLFWDVVRAQRDTSDEITLWRVKFSGKFSNTQLTGHTRRRRRGEASVTQNELKKWKWKHEIDGCDVHGTGIVNLRDSLCRFRVSSRACFILFRVVF